MSIDETCAHASWRTRPGRDERLAGFELRMGKRCELLECRRLKPRGDKKCWALPRVDRSGVTQLPEPVSPSYRNRVPDV